MEEYEIGRFFYTGKSSDSGKDNFLDEIEIIYNIIQYC